MTIIKSYCPEGAKGGKITRLLGGEVKKDKASRQIDKNKTKQVRIDAELHRRLKIVAASENTTIKTLIEGALAELLAVAGGKTNA